MSQSGEGRRLMRQPTQIIRFGAPALGFAYGSVVALTFPHHAAPMWFVWATFAVAATTAAGALFAYGLHRWRELTELSTVHVREVIWPVAALVGVSLAGMNVTAFLPGPSHLNAPGGAGSGLGSGLVGMFAILAAIPAAGVMYGIWRVAARDVLPGKRGEQVYLLLALRRLLQRLLAAAGSVVALVTFAAGTWWLLEHSLQTQFGNMPPQFVLIFGAYGSTIVGLVYGPAWTALQRRGRLLCDEMYPLRKLDQQAAILSRATDRQKLEQILGLDQTIISDLQGGLIILAPLLASAVAAFLPH
jgi:hypothetical protein